MEAVETGVAAPTAEGNPAEAVNESDGGGPERPKETAEERRWRLKVNGTEREMDEAEVLRRAQMAESADERFKEAKRIEREALEFLKAARQDPSLFFKSLGLNEDEYYEQKRKQKEMLESLTEEQREILRLRRVEAELARVKKEREEEAEKQRSSAMMEEAAKRIDVEISSAFKEAGISTPTPRLLKRVADTMYSYLDATGQRLPALQALKHVLREDEEDRIKSFDTDDVSKILPKLPKKFLDAIRKADIESLKSSLPKQSPKPKDGPVTLEKKKFKSTDDIFNELESKLKRK